MATKPNQNAEPTINANVRFSIKSLKPRQLAKLGKAIVDAGTQETNEELLLHLHYALNPHDLALQRSFRNK
jgi:hypothetical protein